MAVAAMLLHGGTELPEPPCNLSPWLGYSPIPLDEILKAYESQKGRRLIKTHTPLDGLPLVEGVHAISVLRNPLGAMRSTRRHVWNMASPPKGDPCLADEEDVIARGPDLPFAPTNVGDVSLELLVLHLWIARDVRAGKDHSVSIVHYSDMKQDLKSVVSRLAATLQVHAEQEFLDELVQAASISSMRARAEQFAPLANAKHFSSSEKFFASGEELGHATPHSALRSAVAGTAFPDRSTLAKCW